MKKQDNINPMENAIVLLDMGITSISILNKLHETFPDETICYINDLEYGEYEGHDSMDIKSRIKKIIEIIANNKPKLLYILNSVYVEYGEDCFEGLPFPVLSIVKNVIDYVNSKYEYKSIAFIANDGMVEANIYQKAFKYNHLYNVKGNNLIEIANAKLMKTKESFNAVRDCASFLQKRDLEIIVTPEINLLLLYTEFNEYFKDAELVKTDEAIIEAIKAELEKFDNGAISTLTKKTDAFLYFNVNDQYREKDAFRKLLKINYEILSYSIAK